MSKIKRALQRSGVLMVAVLFLVLTTPVALAASEEEKVLRVAFPQVYGYTTTDADGRHRGLVVDVLNEVAKYTGWNYEYVDVEPTEMLKRFQAGDFDLMGGQYYLDGLEEYYAYPEYNCGYTKLILLARRDDESIKSYDYSTFQGKTIGVLDRAKENIRRLQMYLEINEIDCTLKYYTYDELLATGENSLNHYLESGEVDLLLGNSADAGETFYIAAAFDSQPHYIVTVPGNQEILDGLNMALERIYQGDPNFTKTLYDNNFPAMGNPYMTLSAEERDYVIQNKTVSVAVTENWHPLFCLNNDSPHDGLLPDILKEVTAFSGLEFTYVYCDSYAEMVDKVQRGEADVLGYYMGSEEDAVARNLALTTPYVTLDSILVRNKESSYPSAGLIGAVSQGRELPNSITVDEVRYYADTTQGLSDVNRGKVDFFYGLSSHLENIIQQENFTNIVQVALVNDSMDIGFALPSPTQPELFTILNKSINNLTESQRSVIVSRNIVSLGESHMSLTSMIYANPGLTISLVAAFLLLVLSIVIVVYRFRLRAAKMQNELEKAEAQNRAKSDFLSRMSHEIRTPMNAIIGLSEITERMGSWPEDARENLEKIKSSSRYLLHLINDILDMSRIESGKMELSEEPFSLGVALDDVRSMMITEAETKNLRFILENRCGHDVFLGDAIRLRQVLVNLLSNAFKFTPPGGSVSVIVMEEASGEKTGTLTFHVKDTGIGIAPQDQERIFQSFEQIGPNASKSQGTGLGLAISSNIVRLMGGELRLRSALQEGSEFYFTITLPKGTMNEVMQATLDDVSERQQESLTGVRILLAEDNDLNAEIAVTLLEQQGAEVLRVENGKKALDLFEASRPGDFEVILMDILMPEMSGLDAAKAIRNLPREDAKTVPIIAMTANAFREDERAAMEAGMTGFVAKPIDVDCLFREIRASLDRP